MSPVPFLFGLLMLLAAGLARAGAYEAVLPDEIHNARRLCDFAPCAEVFPGATRFSERKGQPPYVEAFIGATRDKTPWSRSA